MVSPRRRLAPTGLLAAILMAIALMFPACAGRPRTPSRPPVVRDDFRAHAEETRAFVSGRRRLATRRRDEELSWNSPAEWRPERPSGDGVLLIHGLGDSPFSFVDLGPALAARGFLVRAILLPGCGTNPEDLIGIELDDWRRTVAEHAALLATEVDRVYLGGFSTGANLALDHALADPSIAGLVLFAPAIVSNSSIAFLAPAAAAIMDWVVRPSPEPVSAVRYDMVPTDAFALWWRSSRRLARIAPYQGPALVILSESDSVVASEAVAEQFESRFPHPRSRLIWYGSPPKIQAEIPKERLLVRPDNLPGLRIDNFSHMGILFSPSNPEYGPDGAQRFCDNGQDHDLHARCLSEPLVRYSAWGAALTDEPTARLTFNPWFDWQIGVLDEVWGLEAPAEPPVDNSDPSCSH